MAGKKRKAYSALARAGQERQKRSAALAEVECVLQGIAPVSERVKQPLGESGRPRGQDGLSAHRRPGYSLVGMLASRARLRFTRRAESTLREHAVQGQGSLEQAGRFKFMTRLPQQWAGNRARLSATRSGAESLSDCGDGLLLCCPTSSPLQSEQP
jgi:hypothetical protein